MFEKITPEQAGISSKHISDFLAHCYRNGLTMHSVLMMKGDKIFAEMIHSALEVHLDEDQLVRTAPRTSVPLYEIETIPKFQSSIELKITLLS